MKSRPLSASAGSQSCKMRNKPLPSFSHVSSQLRYEPETGEFFWKPSKRGFREGFEKAGTVTRKGYARIRIDGNKHYAHRLAWLLHYGEWPSAHVDHINTVKTDNRIANLRLADPSQSNFNVGLTSKNTSGVKGVRYSKSQNCWISFVTARGKNVLFGRHQTKDDAIRAVEKTRLQFHGEFARHA